MLKFMILLRKWRIADLEFMKFYRKVTMRYAKKHSGWPSKTSQRQDRRDWAVSIEKSACEITRTLTSPRSTPPHHHIQTSKFHKYCRIWWAPMLILHHKKAHILWAEKYLHWMDECFIQQQKKKKKINLDNILLAWSTTRT